MQYSDFEIRQMYNQALNKNKQIKILAELNACRVSKIEEILGLKEVNDMSSKSDWNVILSDIDSGMSKTEVCERYGVGRRALDYQLKKRSDLTAKPAIAAEPVPTCAFDGLDALEYGIDMARRLVKLGKVTQTRVKTMIENVLLLAETEDM